ncbi:MAG TPA: hypothetical protein VFZ34_05685 [Blastocatellia bacterium]|nr:hypothetical protein [Blastocatellia bacterium]
MEQEEQQTTTSSPSEKWTPPMQWPEPDEEDTDHSVFPHFWLCVPVAWLMCWQFYDWFQARVFFYRIGASGAYGGQADIIGPAWLLTPLLFAALLFFAFWNARFAREGGASKASSLRSALLAMAGTFGIAALITWLLILNKNWTWHL